jgi:hypothetical protein
MTMAKQLVSDEDSVLSTRRITIKGINYLLKEELNRNGDRCYGCSLENYPFEGGCREVPCHDSIVIEDTPEAITNYLEKKLNGVDEEEEEDDE